MMHLFNFVPFTFHKVEEQKQKWETDRNIIGLMDVGTKPKNTKYFPVPFTESRKVAIYSKIKVIRKVKFWDWNHEEKKTLKGNQVFSFCYKISKNK